MRNQNFNDPAPTLGVEFLTKTIDYKGYKIVLQLWDTAGQELFRSVTRSYYRNSSIVFFVFDLTSSKTLAHMSQWITDVKLSLADSFIGIIMGNKCDLTEKREVTNEEARKFAEKHGMQYFETSAKTGLRVSDAFLSCLPHAERMYSEGKLPSSAQKASFIWIDQQESDDRCC
ncbi:small GTP-binding protein [Tritrichomonas foetus]|uniref:Small GTP-binding protein n=1 Tax=Tritrichomonas foetus TaxID=1144522 RepID=A0A1J4KVR7_9EUKA|nr:small GTP-binding protein [Tritrichomonas foetus]|eukprot:OHT14984.1 small GTP-binding protein [Tritrichomonas foetus]